MAVRPESQQAVLSTYAPRLRVYNNSLLTPVLPSAAPANPLARTTKRGTTIIYLACSFSTFLPYQSSVSTAVPNHNGAYDSRKEDPKFTSNPYVGAHSLQLHDSN